jgi:hypothetical protein
MRFLGYTLGDESALPDLPPDPEMFARMGEFVETAVKAGVIPQLATSARSSPWDSPKSRARHSEIKPLVSRSLG